MSATLPTPSLRHVCDLFVSLDPIREMGAGRAGQRRIIPIVGGTVTGPALNGKILHLGADWQTIWANGVAELDTRYAIETEDGATIDIDALKRAGIAKGHDVRVKIVAGGELSKKLVVRAARVSSKDSKPERSKSDRRSEYVVVTSSAAEAIKAAGGAVELS